MEQSRLERMRIKLMGKKPREKISFKEKVKQLNKDQRVIWMMSLVFIWFFIIEIVGGGVMITVATQKRRADLEYNQAIIDYNQGKLNQSAWENAQEKYLQIKTEVEQANTILYIAIGAGFFIGILLFVALYFLMKYWQQGYAMEQGEMDSMEGTISLDDFNTYKYLIQTYPDSATEIKSTEEMFEVYEKSNFFQTLVKSIESDVPAFKYDPGDILKQQMEKELPELHKKLKEVKEDERDSPEIQIRYKKIKTEAIQKLLEKICPFLTTLEKEFDGKLFLYYRRCNKVVRIDDPSIDFNDDEDLEQDKFYSMRDMFYLLPVPEKIYFNQFRRRRSPVNEEITLRKGYFDFRLATYYAGIPVFIDRKLLQEKKVHDRSLADTRLKALTYLTDLMLDKDQDLRDEIKSKDLQIYDLLIKLDKKINEELSRVLHSGELERAWRNRYKMDKINLTGFVMSMLCLGLGFLAGMVIFRA
ncbi:hypothetical protein [Candidatus Harpocratesius sp.]